MAEPGQTGGEAPSRTGPVLGALAVLAALALAILAYGLGVRGFADGPTSALSTSVLLLVGAVVIAGGGGAVVWAATCSVTPAHEIEERAAPVDGTLAARLGENSPAMTSFTNMLWTIEKQTDEIGAYARRLDSAHRELESANARLLEISLTDELTGQSNRRAFSARLEEEVARFERLGHPLSLGLLDVDGFKALNDELGHLAGDATLRGLSDLLLKHVRSIDIVCRFGGDQFAILLVETGRSGAGSFAERLCRLVARHSFEHGRRVTASLGVASIPEDARTAHDLLCAADEALQAAKRAGKNRVAASGDAAPAAGRPRAQRAAV